MKYTKSQIERAMKKLSAGLTYATVSEVTGIGIPSLRFYAKKFKITKIYKKRASTTELTPRLVKESKKTRKASAERKSKYVIIPPVTTGIDVNQLARAVAEKIRADFRTLVINGF